MKFWKFYFLLGAISSSPYGNSWLEMTPREGQKPYYSLNISDSKLIISCPDIGCHHGSACNSALSHHSDLLNGRCFCIQLFKNDDSGYGRHHAADLHRRFESGKS